MVISRIFQASRAIVAGLVLMLSIVFGVPSAQASLTNPDPNLLYIFEEDAQTGFFAPPNNQVGDLVFVNSSYRPATQRFTWEIGYDTNSDGELPDSFVVAINDGPMPKGLTGYIAALYVDATSPGTPVVTAYAYNGEHSQTSHRYGDFTDQNTVPDRIASTLDANSPAFINVVSVDDNDSRADRVFLLDIDATPINAHTPLYPNNGPGWFGLAYDTEIGVWMHPFRNSSPSYDQDGYLTNWNIFWSPTSGNYGWYDFTNAPTARLIIPEPTTALLFGPLAVFAMRRRRRA